VTVYNLNVDSDLFERKIIFNFPSSVDTSFADQLPSSSFMLKSERTPSLAAQRFVSHWFSDVPTDNSAKSVLLDKYGKTGLAGLYFH